MTLIRPSRRDNDPLQRKREGSHAEARRAIALAEETA